MALGFPVVPEEKSIQIGAEKSTGVNESSSRLLVLFSKSSYSSRLMVSHASPKIFFSCSTFF